jgi:hypothetical protein
MDKGTSGDSSLWDVLSSLLKGDLMKHKVEVPFLSVAVFTLCGVAFAHHGSAASYDMSKQVTMTGTVVSYFWSNPHVFILYNVTDDKGKVVEWGAETHAPVVLQRQDNWSGDTFKPGDKITVTVFPSKIGTPRGLLAKIVKDGKVMIDDGASRGQAPE